jgi:hypothetical protein
MLGMKGGGAQSMPQGQNSNVASLFRNNQTATPAAMPQQAQIQPIKAPVRPNIPMPVAQPMPQQTNQVDPMAAFRKHQFELNARRDKARSRWGGYR